jgi:hypothetical protein
MAQHRRLSTLLWVWRMSAFVATWGKADVARTVHFGCGEAARDIVNRRQGQPVCPCVCRSLARTDGANLYANSYPIERDEKVTVGQRSCFTHDASNMDHAPTESWAAFSGFTEM